MSCNGYNHYPNCNCRFSGGHGKSRVRKRSFRPHIIQSYSSRNTSSFDTQNLTQVIQTTNFDQIELNKPPIIEPSKPEKQSFDQLQLDRCQKKGESKTYLIECWFCGLQVFYHTNGYGDCVLFDELGYPWQIHECWQQYWNKKKSQNIQKNVSIILPVVKVENLKISTLPREKQEKIVKEGQDFCYKLDILQQAIEDSKITEEELTEILQDQFSFSCVDDFRKYFDNLYIVYLDGLLLCRYVETIDRWEKKGIKKLGNTYYIPHKYTYKKPDLVKKSHKPIYFFQGIGYLEGVVYCYDKKIWIKQQDQEFELFSLNTDIQRYINSQFYIGAEPVYLYVRVYPQCIWSEKSPTIKFNIIACQTEPFKNSANQKEISGIFTLKGIWQFIPNYNGSIPFWKLYALSSSKIKTSRSY